MREVFVRDEAWSWDGYGIELSLLPKLRFGQCPLTSRPTDKATPGELPLLLDDLRRG